MLKLTYKSGQRPCLKLEHLKIDESGGVGNFRLAKQAPSVEHRKLIYTLIVYHTYDFCYVRKLYSFSYS